MNWQPGNWENTDVIQIKSKINKRKQFQNDVIVGFKMFSLSLRNI